MSASAQQIPFFIYIVRCADDTFYVGHTADVIDRVKTHNVGRGAVWTSCRRPVTLVYQESLHSEAEAIRREHQLKRWTRAKKLALINGDRGKLKALAKRRVR